MTRHVIIAGRPARRVIVERPKRGRVASAYTRKFVHEVRLAAVADEFGLASMLPLGGVMTTERARALMGRKRCETRATSEPEIPSKSSTPLAPPAALPLGLPAGLLAADISRNIYPDRQRQFGADLIGGVL